MADKKPRNFELTTEPLPDTWEFYSQPIVGDEQKTLLSNLLTTFQKRGFIRNEAPASYGNGATFHMDENDWLVGMTFLSTGGCTISLGTFAGGTQIIDNEPLTANEETSITINMGFLSDTTFHLTVSTGTVEILIKKI